MKYLICILSFIFCFQLINIHAQEKHRPKVGLVLSGGGAKGFAHIGVIKALEEAGIPIDYIGGTSMGSIIGILYALGYPADSIEQLVKTQDWPFLLTDRTKRKYLSFEEKEFDGKYFIPYPVNEGRFQMPSSVVSGQNLELLLSRLIVQANADTSFERFPIPFLCIATDIDNGKAEIFKSGWPVTAVRGSMSIPTVFAPTLIHGKTYLDGGIYNNFPVDEVKAMGADIIIGVDVGFSPFHGNEPNSMLRIMEQSIFTHTIEENTRRQQMCDILIKPNLNGFNMMSFDAADTIMQHGKAAAYIYFEKLKHLADSLRSLEPFITKERKAFIKEFQIDKIEVEGFQKIPRTYIEAKLNLKPGKISIDQIDEAIRTVYGTLLFKKASYRIENRVNLKYLIIDVIERPQSIFSLGINYNTEYKASIYFNTSFYNIGLKGSKLSVNALLGENPRINANYFIFSGWNPQGKNPFSDGWRFDFGINAGTNNYILYQYLNGQKISSNRFTDISLDIYTQTIFKNSYAWGIGILNEFTSKKPDINPFDKFGKTSQMLAFHSFLKFDTYDRTYFPREGIKLDIKAQYLTNIYDIKITPGIMVSGTYNIAHSIAKHLTIAGQLSMGTSFIDSIPETYVYRIGGLCTHYTKNSFPFVGLKLLQTGSSQFVLSGISLQWEAFPKHLIIAKANAYNIAGKPLKLFEEDHIQDGYSIGYGYNSLLGPIELTFMTSSKNRALIFLNIGFWF